MVEAPGLRPVLERTGRSHLAARRHVPLAEAAGDIAVLLQDAGQRRAAARPCAGVTGERPRELGDAAHAHAMVVATGEQCGAGWGTHGCDVEGIVRQPHLLHSRQRRGADLTAESFRTAKASVIDEDEQDIRRALREPAGRG